MLTLLTLHFVVSTSLQNASVAVLQEAAAMTEILKEIVEKKHMVYVSCVPASTSIKFLPRIQYNSFPSAISGVRVVCWFLHSRLHHGRGILMHSFYADVCLTYFAILINQGN